MARLPALLVMIAVFTAGPVIAQPPAATPERVPGGEAARAMGDMAVSPQDREFLMRAINAGIYERESAGLVLAREGVPTTVRALGAMLLEDHTALNGALIALAEQREVAVPDALAAPQSMWLAQLQQAGGDTFVALWLEHQLEAHRQMREEFTDAIARDGHPRVVDLARNGLKIIGAHASALRDLDPGAPVAVSE